MKIFVVKVFNDISNNYQGIDDTEIYGFDNEEKAIAKFEEERAETLKYFKERTYTEESELDFTLEEKSFHYNNGKDYITATIEELEVL